MLVPIVDTPDLVLPDYVVFQYRNDFWKVVRHNSTAPRIGLKRKSDDGYTHANKLPQALSRARRVCLELALCNDWKWFVTMTISKEKYDRKDLVKFWSSFQGWIRKLRLTTGKKIPYLLVPEQHGDGSWHLHGFLNSDVDDFLVSFQQLDQEGYRSATGKRLPQKLLDGGYYDWPDYRERFGYCSLGQIRNNVAAAFYVTKYVSKSLQSDALRVGAKLYYNSQGLNRAELLDSVYGPCPPLDQMLVNHYDHCSTGFVWVPHEVGDHPMEDLLEMYIARTVPVVLDQENCPDVVDYYEAAEQLRFL